MTETGHPTSFRLSPEARQILEEIGERMGLRRSAVVELALRHLNDSETVRVQSRPKKSPKQA